jgi:23S rRNA pseudouridine2605 synthase
MRLQRYLAICGVASRRKAEELILDGRVKINGQIVRVLGTKVASGDVVEYDEKRVTPETHKLYIALHKPRGCICTSSDPDGRPTALDLLSHEYKERIYSIGRLDFNTSGLLLFTNDGAFARIVSHPSSGIEKEYLVETSEIMDEASLQRFKKGITVSGIRYKIIRYEIIDKRKSRIVLVEGKNREIRKLFESEGYYVIRIHRTRVGPVRLGKLEEGGHRSLNESEIARLFSYERKRT